jgi:hypothetical protein
MSYLRSGSTPACSLDDFFMIILVIRGDDIFPRAPLKRQI